MCPPKFTSLLAPTYASTRASLVPTHTATNAPNNTLVMNGYNFVNDCAAIFAGLVEVFYSMRNLLFHGELVPDTQANRTYEPAYHLVRHLTRCIT